jgi:hypothetical protein
MIDPRRHAEAVEFDLVHPLRAAGGFSTGWESCGGTNCGRGAFRRERPALVGFGAERLMTRGIKPNQNRNRASNARTFTLATD